MKLAPFCAVLTAILVLTLAAAAPRALAQGNGISADSSETPVGPVTKNRPPAPSGHTQLCLTLSDPMDCSPPGSSVHGIFQARVLEWGTNVFSDI